MCAIGDEDGLKIWKMTDENSPVLSVPLHHCTSLQFHRREMLLAATSFSNNLAQVHFFDLEKMKEECSVKVGVNKINKIEFHSEKSVLFASSDQKLDVIGWEPNDIYDHVVTDWKTPLASVESNGSLLVISQSERSSGRISAVDLSRLVYNINDRTRLSSRAPL